MRNLDGMWRVLPLDGARFKDIRDNEGVCAELFRIFQPSFDEKRQIPSAKAGMCTCHRTIGEANGMARS